MIIMDLGVPAFLIILSIGKSICLIPKISPIWSLNGPMIQVFYSVQISENGLDYKEIIIW